MLTEWMCSVQIPQQRYDSYFYNFNCMIHFYNIAQHSTYFIGYFWRDDQRIKLIKNFVLVTCFIINNNVLFVCFQNTKTGVNKNLISREPFCNIYTHVLENVFLNTKHIYSNLMALYFSGLLVYVCQTTPVLSQKMIYQQK